MVAAQKNFKLFGYLDDGSQFWNLRGEDDAVRHVVDGSVAAGAYPGWGRSTRRHSPRKITYIDLTTFRKKDVVFYTPTAWSAVTLLTDTLSFMVEGEATAVVYTASKRVPERLPSATASGAQLIDHA